MTHVEIVLLSTIGVVFLWCCYAVVKEIGKQKG
jgi:hypothetical protein